MPANSPVYLALVVTVAAVLFLVGARYSAAARGWRLAAWLFGGCLLAAPAVLYALHYVVPLDRVVWVYELRAVPGSELLAGGAGLLAGVLHPRAMAALAGKARPLVSGALVPVLLVVGLFAPYAKVILRPLPPIGDTWRDDVCMQTTPATCGPCAAATLLRARGRTASEAELAQASGTSGSSTEAWYLIRALRARNLAVDLRVMEPNPASLPTPSIAGTQLGHRGGPGHFIAVLERKGDHYVVGDSLLGRLELSRNDLAARYHFTGLFLRFP